LQLQKLSETWATFTKSPTGRKINKVLPRLLKATSLPEALRILEKETNFRFDLVLMQLQDPRIRQIFVAQAVKPVGQFFAGFKVPSELKQVLNKADDLIHNKMGLQVREFIDPVLEYIKSTFGITKESVLDLKAEDAEKIASDILTREVLEPLVQVYGGYEIARRNPQCAPFVYCQMNKLVSDLNFIRRNVVKSAR